MMNNKTIFVAGVALGAFGFIALSNHKQKKNYAWRET